MQIICHLLIMTTYTKLLDKPAAFTKLRFSSCPPSRKSTCLHNGVSAFYICSFIYTSAHKLPFKQCQIKGGWGWGVCGLPSVLYFLQVVLLPDEYVRLLCLLWSSHSFRIGRTTAAVGLVASSVDHRDGYH